jgi:hypothetical protein
VDILNNLLSLRFDGLFSCAFTGLVPICSNSIHLSKKGDNEKRAGEGKIGRSTAFSADGNLLVQTKY